MLRPDQIERADKIRAAQDVVLPYIAATPKAVNEATAIIRDWEPGTPENPITYVGEQDVRMEAGIPYMCVAPGHTHRGEPDWNPSKAPALWKQYHGTSPETARPYIMEGGHAAYHLEEYAIEDGKIYECIVDNTVNPPSVLPGNWRYVRDVDGGVSGGDADDADPSGTDDEWPEWVAFDGTNASRWMTGSQCSHAGKRWVSGIDYNTHEPGTQGAPWTEV